MGVRNKGNIVIRRKCREVRIKEEWVCEEGIKKKGRGAEV